MPIKFAPEGHLDITSDPSKLPFTISGKIEFSGAMRRCTNLHLDRAGIAQTRPGSSKLNTTALSARAYALLEQGGYRYAFAGTDIYRDEASLSASGLTSALWSAMLYNPFGITTQTVFGVNGTDRKKIEGTTIHEWGITPPSAAPTVAVGTGAGLTGSYRAKVTYVRKSGSTVVCESNPSDASAAQSLTNQALRVTWSASSDPQVTHVRIYRTQAGGSTYYYDQEVAIGSTSVDTTTADNALGTEVDIDHDRPPLGTIVAGPTYQGYVFILKDNLLYWCRPKYPEYWPATYYVEVCPIQFPLKAIIDYFGTWYCMNDREIFNIQGSGTSSFFTTPMKASCGTKGAQAVEAVKGLGILHLGNDGIYAFTQSGDSNITNEQFRLLFEGETVGNIPGINTDALANCLMKVFNNKLYFAYPSAGETYPDNVLVVNISTKKASHYQYPFSVATFAIDYTNRRLLAADTDGYIWHIEDTSKTDDGGTAIAWQIESKAFTDQVHKYFPRYAKYDLSLDSSSATANGYILLNDVVKQTHTLTESRKTRQRLITECNGDRLGIRITGTGQVSFYAAEVE
jgi:hypothetical protein